jgi:muconolactone D-isomerase
VNPLHGLHDDRRLAGAQGHPACVAALAHDALGADLTETLTDGSNRTVQQGQAAAQVPPPRHRPTPGASTMDYLVEFVITIPDDAPPAEVAQRTADETTRVAELAAQGRVLRVWKPLPEDGHRRALGLYRAASDEELEAILDSLPLRPWMEVSVTALAKHPNDPARSAA